MKHIFSKFFILSFIFLIACEPEIDVPTPSSGNLDLSNYVAIGDSYTAGFSDGALHLEPQRNSFPAILAQQMQLAGATTNFTQPLVPMGNGLGSSGNGKIILEGLVNGIPILSVSEPDLDVLNSVASNGSFNNMGVSGAKSFHLLSPEYGNPQTGNPLYARFSENPGGVSVMDEVIAQNPSFFTLWIGGNDLLGYAFNGADDNLGNLLTEPAIFDQSVKSVVNVLKNNNSEIEGAIGNLPNILDIPYFHAVAWNAAELTAAQAIEANDVVDQQLTDGVAEQVYQEIVNGFLDLGFDTMTAEATADAAFQLPIWQDTIPVVKDSLKMMAIAAGELPVFTEGVNPVLVEDPNTILGIRGAVETDLILLSALIDDVIESGALADKYVLDAEEQAIIEQYRQSYNASLEQIISENNFAKVDLESFFEDVVNGLVVDGIIYDASFILGNVFSLDGIHLTQRGSAFFANEYIKAINTHYGSAISQAQPNDYPAILFPE